MTGYSVGALFVVDCEDNNKYKAVGIVSAGLPVNDKNIKCDVSNYQLYTDVASYYQWIKKVLFETYDGSKYYIENENYGPRR